VIPLPGLHNLRDLGGYATARGGTTPWRQVLRADSPHRLDAAGVGRLEAEGLGTVVDLRTAAELAEAPNPFAARPDVAFAHLPVFDALAPGALAARGGGEPLGVFYRDMLDTRHEALREILSVIAGARPGAVMFHCTAGKDRTGLIAALLLSLAGVAPEDIVADYAMTEALIAPLVAEFLAASRARGGDTEAYARLLRAPADTMQATLGHLVGRYGDARGYLRHIGLSAGDIAALQDRLRPAALPDRS
jgi:protein-tyrosine phosphatase